MRALIRVSLWLFSCCSASAALLAPLARLTATFTQRQSAAGRAAAEEAIAELASDPSQVADVDLNGRWKLMWSSQTADVNPFATPDEVLGGQCYQDIEIVSDGVSRLNNVVEWSPGWKLIGGAAIEPTAAGGSYNK